MAAAKKKAAKKTPAVAPATSRDELMDDVAGIMRRLRAWVKSLTPDVNQHERQLLEDELLRFNTKWADPA